MEHGEISLTGQMIARSNQPGKYRLCPFGAVPTEYEQYLVSIRGPRSDEAADYAARAYRPRARWQLLPHSSTREPRDSGSHVDRTLRGEEIQAVWISRCVVL